MNTNELEQNKRENMAIKALRRVGLTLDDPNSLSETRQSVEPIMENFDDSQRLRVGNRLWFRQKRWHGTGRNPYTPVAHYLVRR